jgi:hypothetical protein
MSSDLLNNIACPSIARAEMRGQVLCPLEALPRALSLIACQKSASCATAAVDRVTVASPQSISRQNQLKATSSITSENG